MSDAFELEICQGKYRYRYEAGKQEVWRNGYIWQTLNGKLIGDKFVFSLAVELDEALKERDALRAKIDSLEATEKDSAHHKALAESALRVAKGWEEKCNALRAKIAAMEQQEPVACKNCNGMGDRFDPSGEKIPCDLCESHLEEIRSLVAEAAHDVISGSDFWLSISLAAKKIYALPGAQEQEPTRDWWDCLIADISAIDCMYRGSPTYAHDAYWMRDRVVRMLKKRRDALPGAQTQPAPSVPTALLVAVADLTAQMEIVSRVGFVDTPNDKDSCAAFCVAEGTWLEFTRAVESLASAFAVTVAEQVPAEGEQK